MSSTQTNGESCESTFLTARSGEGRKPVGGTLKRIFDFSFSVLAVLTAMPFFLILPVIIWSVAPGPAFFAHRRVGHNGKMFPCLKFRTMVLNADEVLKTHLASNPDAREEFARHQKLKKDPRIIPVVGEFLRKTSLDELPQFVNVIRGEMSVVGPRPITTDELRNYGKAAAHYKSARPGLTGLWQVSGRSDLSFAERVELDTSYVLNCSILLDLRLIVRTIGVLLSGKGAY